MLSALLKRFAGLVRWVTIGLSVLVLLYFAGQLVQIQAYMPLTAIEDMVFVPQDSSLLLSAGVVFLILVALAPLLRQTSPRTLFWVGSLLYLLAGVYLIVNVDPIIRADAKRVFEAALSMNQGDFSSLTERGAYLYLHPHQLGLVTLERFYLLFSDSPVWIFLINLVLVLSTIYYQMSISQRLYGCHLVTCYQLVLSFTFLPQFFFILFAYGAIPGAFLIVFATHQFLLYRQTTQTSAAISGLLAAALAGIVRNNYQIFLIALLILWLAAYGKTALKSYLILPLGLLVSFFLMSKALTLSYQAAIGQPLSDGVPKIAYVTMGLQADPKGAVGGWWNTYNTRLLKKTKYDQKAAKEKALSDLGIELERFISTPTDILPFFTKKVQSTWLDPTFQSIWTGPLVQRRQHTHTPLLRSIYEEGSGYAFLNRYGSVWLWLTYALAALYWLFCWRLRSTDWLFELLPFVFFLGGVLFHLIWETKSQYVLVYLSLLIQPAAYSLGKIAELFVRKQKNT